MNKNSWMCVEYWTNKGFTIIQANEEIKKKRKAAAAVKSSPFSREHWLKKGYSIEEADLKRNSFRPIRKEFWMKKGYSEIESEKLAKEAKESNNKKGAKNSKNRSIEDIRNSNVKCIKHWINLGYSENEAKKIISKSQITFSLEKCIEKFGIEKGTRIWKQRQEKWQNTLQNKSESDICQINKRKGFSTEKFDSKECFFKYLSDHNINVARTVDDFQRLIKEDLYYHPNKKYWPIEKYFDDIKISQKKILNLDLNKFKQLYSENFLNIKEYQLHTWGMCKWVGTSLLRSSYEIHFYEKYLELSLDKKISLSIDKPYPSSNMRYDFKIGNQFIEICPMILDNDKYKLKMLKKQTLFNSVLLSTVVQIDEFLGKLKDEMFN